MVKIVSGIFIDVSIYGCVRDEKRSLEVTSVAGVVARGGRKQPKSAGKPCSFGSFDAVSGRQTEQWTAGVDAGRSDHAGGPVPDCLVT